MVTIFWDLQGMIYVNSLERDKIAAGLYYIDLLAQFYKRLPP